MTMSTKPANEARAEIAERQYTPADYDALVADLKNVEAGTEFPKARDRDLRTRAGQIWRMIEQLRQPHPAAPADAGDAPKITRYEFQVDTRGYYEAMVMVEDSQGEYVKYEDHIAALAAARRLLDAPPGVGERMREALLAKRRELQARVHAYSQGDRPPSPPAELLKELRDIELALAAPAPAEPAIEP